jgi:UDPglucose 6-dehydrogenase
MCINIGVIGNGFVGKAVVHGFTKDDNSIVISDPLLGTTTKDVMASNPEVIFICVPTPMSDDGSIDSSIIDTVIKEINGYDGIIVLKSTVTPDIVKSLSDTYERFVYNPEFLTETNALHDFEHATHHVFGGRPNVTKLLEEYYNNNTICIPAPKYHMSAPEASFVKYGMNSFLAAKVLFFNQWSDAIESFGCSYSEIMKGITADPRIGISHTSVPGPDGRKGYGGACFPKDTTAISNLFPDLTIIRETITRNNEYRNLYELDDREKAQNVSYNIHQNTNNNA